MPQVTLFRPSQTPRGVLLPVALLAAYVASAAVAYAMTVGSGGLAVLWINNGLLAASLLLLPRGPAILLAILCTFTDFSRHDQRQSAESGITDCPIERLRLTKAHRDRP